MLRSAMSRRTRVMVGYGCIGLVPILMIGCKREGAPPQRGAATATSGSAHRGSSDAPPTRDYDAAEATAYVDTLVGQGGTVPVPEPGKGLRADTPNALQRGYEKPVAMVAPKGPYRGADCQAAYAPRPARDASPMCFAPGGSFVMGAPPNIDLPAAQPARKVTLSPFFIDQFEVTRAQFARFLNEAKHGLQCFEISGTHNFCPKTSLSSRDWALAIVQDGKPIDYNDARYTASPLTFMARPGEENAAMSNVTPIAAAAYCAWVGKQLPSNAEWEYAARVEPLTGKLRTYPWGNTFRKGATLSAESKCRGAACSLNVEAYPGDVSAIGVRNLAGLVHEWLRECVSPNIPDCGACVDPVGDTDCRLGPIIQTEEIGLHVERGYARRGGDRYSSKDDYLRTFDRRKTAIAGFESGFRCQTPAHASAAP